MVVRNDILENLISGVRRMLESATLLSQNENCILTDIIYPFEYIIFYLIQRVGM